MSDLTLNDPDQLPDHLRTILAQHAGPGLSIISADEKRRAAEKLRAILSAAVEVAEESAPTNLHPLSGGGCMWCDGFRCTPDCPHRRLKEALTWKTSCPTSAEP